MAQDTSLRIALHLPFLLFQSPSSTDMLPVRHQVEAICEQIALKLKEEREQRGLSLNSLSEKAGLSRQTVAFIEQGLRTPTVATLLRLTLAMNVELEKLIADARHNASTKKQKR